MKNLNVVFQSDLIFEMTRVEWQLRPSASSVKERLVTLMIPIAEEMYTELMKALTASVVKKLYVSDEAAAVAAPPSPSAAFMLDILDDLSVVGFVQPGQYRDAQDNLELQRQKELQVKVRKFKFLSRIFAITIFGNSR